LAKFSTEDDKISGLLLHCWTKFNTHPLIFQYPPRNNIDATCLCDL